MEPALILRTSTILLAIAALGGLAMAGIRFASDRQPPTALAVLHGFLAAAAVTLLLYAAATVGLPGMALGALVLFLLAAGGVIEAGYSFPALSGKIGTVLLKDLGLLAAGSASKQGV